ncbi:MAG: hypothetical protein PUB22_04830, partial [Clostridiales bacterium]|nr:hypothetical protein [Clostridiales bacterium]
MEWNDGWNMASQSSYDTAEKKNGSRSIKVLGDPESVNYASISIPMEVSSDTTFLVSAWGKANSVPETS